MTGLALVIALYAGLVLLLPGLGPPFVSERRAVMPWALTAHLSGSLLALALGPWQLNARLRHKAIHIHRWIGRGYVAGVAVGALGALRLATVSQGGMMTHLGFGLLAVLWLLATLQAYRKIRARDQADHRRWMIRSYALTLAAVTLRIYLPASQLLGIPFGDAYQWIAWACWVPNLLVAEWWLLRPLSGPSAAAT